MQVLVFFEHPVQQPGGNSEVCSNKSSSKSLQEEVFQCTTLPEPGALRSPVLMVNIRNLEVDEHSPPFHGRVTFQ